MWLGDSCASPSIWEASEEGSSPHLCSVASQEPRAALAVASPQALVHSRVRVDIWG